MKNLKTQILTLLLLCSPGLTGCGGEFPELSTRVLDDFSTTSQAVPSPQASSSDKKLTDGLEAKFPGLTADLEALDALKKSGEASETEIQQAWENMLARYPEYAQWLEAKKTAKTAKATISTEDLEDKFPGISANLTALESLKLSGEASKSEIHQAWKALLAKYPSYNKMMQGKKSWKKLDMASLEEEIQAAFEAGKLSQAEADEKRAYLEKPFPSEAK